MKYFTDELWSKINSESAIEREQARIEWDKNLEISWKLFDSIKYRLSKKFLKLFFEADGFHDCDFQSFEVIQPKEFAIDPITVRIVISDGEYKWTIKYKKVKKIMINYDLVIDEYGSRGMDTWGYSEFLTVDDNYLSCEILFASGATILIQFKNKNLFVDKEPMETGKDIPDSVL